MGKIQTSIHGREVGLDVSGNLVLNKRDGSEHFALVIDAADGTGNILTPDGGIIALSEVSPVVTLTETDTAVTGACEFGGFVVRSESGGTADVTIYDATSATGTAIMTAPNVTTGTYFWLGDHATAGVGVAGRRANTTGCHVVIAGTATIDVLVAAT